MPTVIVFFCLANLALTGVLIWRVLHLTRTAVRLQAEVQGGKKLPPGSAGTRIEVEILNPFALAARETAFAKPASAVAPELIRRIVYDRAALDIIKELKDRGVEARVSVRRA